VRENKGVQHKPSSISSHSHLPGRLLSLIGLISLVFFVLPAQAQEAVPDTTPPATPTGLSVSVASSSELSLSWNTATDDVGVTGYRVYKRSVSSGPDTLVTTLGLVTTYADTGLAPYTKFWYSVSALDAAGNESAKTELRSGRTAIGNGDADLPAGALGPDISVGIFNYTTNDLRSSALRIRADKPFSVLKKSGEKMFDIPADKNIRITYLSDKNFRIYDPDTDVTLGEAMNEVRFEAADPNAVFDISRPNSSYDRYRGDLRVRYYDSSVADADRIWVINILPLEHYVWGMGEITGTGPSEYNKVMTTIFRTYGYWKLKWSTKYADQGFKVDATSASQIYYGYDWEVTHPEIRKGAEATQGQLVMYNGKIALTAYSSWTDGSTRRFEDGHWGHVCTTETGKVSSIYPWLSAAPDPDGKHPTESTCSLAASGNHMVGLSANGAVRMAKNSGRDARSILQHYFPGVAILKVY